jgi:hypothetical protein
MKKFAVITLAMLAPLVSAATKSHQVTLYQPTVVAGTELKPGDYQLKLDNGKIVLKKGKVSVESPAKIEDVSSEFGSTAVRFETVGGKYHIREIRIGKTSTKVTLSPEDAAATAGTAGAQ